MLSSDCFPFFCACPVLGLGGSDAPPILVGRKLSLFPEYATKGVFIFIAHPTGDLTDGKGRISEQHAGGLHPDLLNIIGWSAGENGPEPPYEGAVADAHVS